MAAINTAKGPIVSAHTNRIGIVTGDHRSILTSNSETTNVKNGAGFLHQLVIGNVGSSWQIDFYDDLLGAANKVYTWVSADGKNPPALQIPLANGLTIVESGTTAGQATAVWS